MATTTKLENQTIDIADSVELREGTSLDMSLKSDPWTQTVWKRLKKNPVALYSLYYTIAMVLLAIFYPILIPSVPSFTPSGLDPLLLGGGSRSYPSLRYPMGTDLVGRDVVTLLLAGSYTSMIVGFGSTILFLTIGIPLGLIAGFYSDRAEEIILRFTDFVLALPFLVIVILAIKMMTRYDNAFLDAIPTSIIILLILGIFGWAGTTRLVTASTKQVVNLEYIAAARTLGASNNRMILKHVLPNILAPIIVVATYGIALGILSEAGLTFLGFGDPFNEVSWGGTIVWGQDYLYLHPQLSIAPGFAVFFAVFSINIFGDAIRDALDPRLKE